VLLIFCIWCDSYMFQTLSERLSGILDKLRGRGTLTEADVVAAMREVRVAFLEVFCREESRPLADCRGQDRRVDTKEPALVEEIVDALLDLVADHRDRTLAR